MLLQRSRIMIGVAALLFMLSGLVGVLQLRGVAFLPTRVVPAESDAPDEAAIDVAAALEEQCQSLRQGCETQCGYWAPEYQVQQCFPACASEYEACVAGERTAEEDVSDGTLPEQVLFEEPVSDIIGDVPPLPEITE